MVSVIPATQPRRRRWWIYAFVILTGAGLATAALWWRSVPAKLRALDPNWIATTTVLAGNGVTGTKDGWADEAQFSDPFGVAVGADGTVYVADAGERPRIRAISPDGKVWTIAGGTRGFADGEGSAARFDTPSAIAIDSHGSLYVADTGNNAIRRVGRNGDVSTVAGDTTPGYRDGPAQKAQFNGPVGVAVAADGRIIVADTYNDRVRAIERDGTVRTLAGGEPGFVDGDAGQARFQTPCGVFADTAGNIHVADTGNGVLRFIDAAGHVSTAFVADGSMSPVAVAVGQDGSRDFSDERGRVFALAPSGELRPLAGSTPGFHDGEGIEARFRSPAGLALAGPGRLIVTDTGNALVRVIEARGRDELRRPPYPRIAPHFDVDRFALSPLLWPIAPMDGPYEVAGTIGEARGVEGSERFHAGIDVRAPEGTPVSAVRDGVVATVIATGGFQTLTESVRVGPLAYVHIRVGRVKSNQPLPDTRFAPIYGAEGTLLGMRVKRGARFTAGDVIGTVNGFNHVHLNVGWPGEELNPLAFRLVHFQDHVPPTIKSIRLQDDQGRPLTERRRRRIVLTDRVQIIVDAWDTADGNKAGRRLGVYDLGYQVLKRDGTPSAGFEQPRHTLRFDRVAADPAIVRTVYATGSGIPFYGQRRTRFLYIVSNTFRDGVASPGWWDTTALAPGDYTLRIWAADISGNVAIAKRDLAVTIAGPGASTR
jgi:murein DD-endopeptidase MepM/ murein hydrolase activator NlpD